jgi:hypothetical protein
MLLFGVYFPERLKFDRRWPWAKWILIIPLLVILFLNIILEVGALENMARIAPLARIVLRLEPGDLLVAYTDGISEAMNKEEEEWGEADDGNRTSLQRLERLGHHRSPGASRRRLCRRSQTA